MGEFNRTTNTVISNAQNLLMADSTQNPTASLIKEVVERAASIMPKREDEPIDIDGAIAELIRRYSIWIGQNSTLSDDSDHEAWLGSSRKRDGATGHGIGTCLSARCLLQPLMHSKFLPMMYWACLKIQIDQAPGTGGVWWSGTSSPARLQTTQA